MLEYKKNAFATHQPFLWHFLKKTKKPILELGAGYGSTPLLHTFSEHFSIPLTTVDHDWNWLGYFKEYQSTLHELVYADIEEEGWESYIHCIPEKEWGVVFIDQGSWQSRIDTARALRDKADYIIIHDVDYLVRECDFGKNGDDEFDFSSEFPYFKTFYPEEPWPAPTGPPTLVASMRHEIHSDILETSAFEDEVNTLLKIHG